MRFRAPLLTAALACSLALAGCGDQPGDGAAGGSRGTDDSTSAATPNGPDTSIPDDFPLSAGMGGPGDAIPTTRTGTGLRDLELCGTSPLRGLGERDRMVADNSGGEALSTRELVLLGSPERAAEVAQSLADLPTDCRTPAAEGKWETRTEVRASPFGPSPAAVLVQTYRVDGEAAPGALVVNVVPAGAALLVTQEYGEWEDLDAGLDAAAGTLGTVIAALQSFADGGTPTATPTGTPTETPTEEPAEEPAGTPTEEPAGTPVVTEVPADFPLGTGLPEGDDETDVYGPSPDADGMGEVEMCGRVVWPASGAGATRRLVTGALGPEYFDGRELVVHEDADRALRAMEAIRRAAEECRAIDNQVWTVLDRDTGYDTVTMGLTYDDGLGSSVFQVTRVGSARLMVQTYGEGSLASLDQQADGVTETTGTIVSAMCVFTKTGC
ncbi:hypothetical protein F4692_002448 [Nocardioides cavernae]|uniref:PknH-like extracellular domain-containing protein n=1 Tax=Nocardioides cavernae TaxID=1921566 RepID=A0A7Y9KS72_9ACTN|nr:hypothetical protein [Nocardioides cavernae]NYE37315.1 hypothetical protein [Nocardioides cavernae]